MEDRGQFNAMLAWTHGAACIIKTLFSLLVSDRANLPVISMITEFIELLDCVSDGSKSNIEVSFVPSVFTAAIF